MHYPLRQLEARLGFNYIEQHTPGVFVNGVMSPDGVHRYRRLAESLAEAHDIMFLCPLCYEKNGGAVGTHSVLVSFAGREIPEGCGSISSAGVPSRWTVVSGTGLDDLVLSPSILLSPPGCTWHGFVGSSGIPPGHAG